MERGSITQTTTRSAEDVLLGMSVSNTDSSDKTLLICSIFENQRPLKGTVGLLDWRMRGFLSSFVLGSKITGKESEIVYIPIKHHGGVRHLLLVGLGSTDSNPDENTIIEKISQAVTSL